MSWTLPPHLFSDLLVTLLFGVLAIGLLLGAVKMWDWMTTKIDEQQELNNNNMSVAVVLSAYMLCVAYIIGQVVSRVIGGG